ncbi:MAG TPA: HDIG domain-containing protein [Thermoanaerobaculaceae bacterium]|nr:HDIG domain-containing protein [Thermoanaerobaculaceae bacterium]
MSHDRETAWKLLCEWTQSEALRKHALSAEAAMRAHARRLGQDDEAWGVVGLLHDFDYERFDTVETHVWEGARVLRAGGWPEAWVRAIEGHAEYTGVPRDTDLARCLFAVDELTGFLTASALVRPDKSIASVQVDSVKKKLKDKAFARAVNREDIRRGAEELGMTLEDHIAFVRDAMATIAPTLGLPPADPCPPRDVVVA